MSDAPADLGAILARTAAFGVAPQTCAAGSSETALGFVLEAIRTCILPRDLTVFAGGTPCLRMEVAGGCLLRILEITARDASDPSFLLERPLRATDPQDMAATTTLLRHLFQGDLPLSIGTRLPETEVDPAHAGISAAHLLSAVSLVALATAMPDRLAYFIEAAEDVLFAVLAETGTPRLLRPDFALDDALQKQIHALFSHPGGIIRNLTASDMLFLRSPNETDPAIGLTRSNGSLLALIVEADAYKDLASFWASLPHAMVFHQDR
jgi:hypothetical protein